MHPRIHHSYHWIKWLVKNEWLVLLTLAAILGGVWVFVEVAEEVLEGETGGFDDAILMVFRTPDALDDPIGPHWFEEMARDVTALGSIAVQFLVTAAMAGALLIARRPRAAVLVIFAVGTGVLLSSLLKEGFQRPRPEIVPHAVETFTLSFPSGHSMTAAVTYLVLGALMGQATPIRAMKLYFLVLALLFAFLIGLSRIYLGVHYPTDVIAGWTAGTVWALLWWLVAEWLGRHGHLRRLESESAS